MTTSKEHGAGGERGEAGDVAGQAWRPSRVVLGGWTAHRPRDELCQTVEAWMRTLPPELTDLMLVPLRGQGPGGVLVHPPEGLELVEGARRGAAGLCQRLRHVGREPEIPTLTSVGNMHDDGEEASYMPDYVFVGGRGLCRGSSAMGRGDVESTDHAPMIIRMHVVCDSTPVAGVIIPRTPRRWTPSTWRAAARMALARMPGDAFMTSLDTESTFSCPHPRYFSKFHRDDVADDRPGLSSFCLLVLPF